MPAPSGSATEAELSLLRARREAALRALGSTVGTTALCTLARDGIPMPAAKFHEGSAAALADLVRRVSARPGVPLLALARASLAGWDEAAAARGDLGGDWSAYDTGGREALRQLIEDLLAQTA